jgi:hypothetical protein
MSSYEESEPRRECNVPCPSCNGVLMFEANFKLLTCQEDECGHVFSVEEFSETDIDMDPSLYDDDD